MKNFLFESVEENKKEFDWYFENAADYYYKAICICNQKCAVIMCEDLVDSEKLWQVFLQPLNNLDKEKTPQKLFDYIINETTIPFNRSPVDNFEQAMFFLYPDC